MTDLCTVCGEPRPCPAAREISEPAIWVGTCSICGLPDLTHVHYGDHTFILPNDTSGESQQFVTDIRSLRAALDALDD